jgi:hypothetical protein
LQPPVNGRETASELLWSERIVTIVASFLARAFRIRIALAFSIRIALRFSIRIALAFSIRIAVASTSRRRCHTPRILFVFAPSATAPSPPPRAPWRVK